MGLKKNLTLLGWWLSGFWGSGQKSCGLGGPQLYIKLAEELCK